jgi:hypothetical protein
MAQIVCSAGSLGLSQFLAANCERESPCTSALAGHTILFPYVSCHFAPCGLIQETTNIRFPKSVLSVFIRGKILFFAIASLIEMR